MPWHRIGWDGTESLGIRSARPFFCHFVGVGLAMLFSSAFTTDASFHEILVIDLIDQIPIVLEIPA